MVQYATKPRTLTGGQAEPESDQFWTTSAPRARCMPRLKMSCATHRREYWSLRLRGQRMDPFVANRQSTECPRHCAIPWLHGLDSCMNSFGRVPPRADCPTWSVELGIGMCGANCLTLKAAEKAAERSALLLLWTLSEMGACAVADSQRRNPSWFSTKISMAPRLCASYSW